MLSKGFKLQIKNAFSLGTLVFEKNKNVICNENLFAKQQFNILKQLFVIMTLPSAIDIKGKKKHCIRYTF